MKVEKPQRHKESGKENEDEPVGDYTIVVEISVTPALEKWRRGEITFEEYFEELKKFVEENIKTQSGERNE